VCARASGCSICLFLRADDGDGHVLTCLGISLLCIDGSDGPGKQAEKQCYEDWQQSERDKRKQRLDELIRLEQDEEAGEKQRQEEEKAAKAAAAAEGARLVIV
jgi:hypothetical protein